VVLAGVCSNPECSSTITGSSHYQLQVIPIGTISAPSPPPPPHTHIHTHLRCS
jgi:hypothetical protein